MGYVDCIKDRIKLAVMDCLMKFQNCMNLDIEEINNCTVIGGHMIDLLAGGTDIGPLYVQFGN